MDTALNDPRERLVKLINLDRSRVQLEPYVIFICGGPVDITAANNHSIRNMFMNLSGVIAGSAEAFVLAENFKDWERGYSSLSDFENDIAYLSTMVVVFLESEGALTEFGLFFGNPKLREKLVAVVHSEFHRSESFIKFGMFNPMERKDQNSVRVYNIDHREIDKVDISEVKDILDDIVNHCELKPKTEKFQLSNRGHRIFFVFQIIELFQALTKFEIKNYLNMVGIDMIDKDIDSSLYILHKFNFIDMEKKSSQYFFFIRKRISDRIEFHFNKLDDRRYDAATIKIEVAEFYDSAKLTERTHKRRLKVLSSELGEQAI